MPIYGVPPGLVSDPQLFQLTNVCLPGWIVLALAPKKAWARGVAMACALFLAVMYVATVTGALMATDGDADYWKDITTYEGVQRLLAAPAATLPCWFHYACFDLWTGVWIAADSQQRGVPHLLLIPILFLTMMLGPTGLVLYFLLRVFFKGSRAVAKSKTA